MLYTVPPAESLAKHLAQWLLAEYGDNLQALANVLILLPSRRTISGVKQEFLRMAGGKPLLLPQLVAVADIDETLILRHGKPSAQQVQEIESLLPAPPAKERLLLLQELIWRHGQKMIPRLHDREAALDLAVNLIALIDEMDREGGDWQQLDSLAPEELAEHWQQTLEFLKIIRQYWPEVEKEKGWGRPWQRRNILLKLLGECWQENPPETPVIAAGSTGSVPAVAELLKVIHHLPKGSVILPGFDQTIGQESLPPTHPQTGMQELVATMGVSPQQVEPLPVNVSEHPISRQELLSCAMLPAEALEQWHATSFNMEPLLKDIYYLQQDNEQELALSVALLMREALEQPDKTTALITPDRQMARAVSAHLARWDIQADDSAGQPLGQIQQAIFIQLIIEAVRYGLRPVSLLALMKHPLCVMGRPKAAIYELVRELEKNALRGMVSPDWSKIKESVPTEKASFMLLEEIETALTPLLEGFEAVREYPFSQLITQLLEVAEKLTQNEQAESLLWQGEGAAELASFFSGLTAMPLEQQISAEELPGMLRALMRTEVVRPRYGAHPRLQILSPMEARLQRYDRVILADLNEGGWPESAQADPWMNREMRKKLGLPSPDKRVGLQAHDFAQQVAGGEVFLLRTAKSGGAETVPSRFIQRLEVLIDMNGQVDWKSHPVQDWVQVLLNPQKVPAAKRPAPTPPVQARPRELSVTRIERLMQDPYSIYAQKILHLKKLEELEPEPSHREFGNLVHEVLEQHFMQGRDVMECADEIFKREKLGYIADSLWWPRLERIATWIKEQATPHSMHCEVKGEWKFQAPAGEFVLSARVDRIDESITGFNVIDYKTGAPMPAEWMRQGMASQLTLTAVMIGQGAFGAALAGKQVESLEYWKLGGKTGGEKIAFATAKEESFGEAVQQAYEALPRIIAAYDNDNKPYESIPEYRFKPRYNDYEHLARIQEWLD